MSASEIAELEASIQELIAERASAGPEMIPILDQQLNALQSTIQLLRAAAPAIAATKQTRPALSAELTAFFRPEPPAPVPAWLPDNTTRETISEADMRCPEGAQLYTSASSISCAFPGTKGHTRSVAHGLTLHFTNTGKLSSQAWYENGCIRWSLSYHLLGGRDCVGFYASREPLTYIQEGLHTRYAPNGTIVAQAHFQNGQMNGWQKLWEEDGYPISATLYQNGKPTEEIRPDGSHHRL